MICSIDKLTNPKTCYWVNEQYRWMIDYKDQATRVDCLINPACVSK